MADPTDGSQPGISSEDLIRQARAPYEPAETGPPDTTSVPTSHQPSVASQPTEAHYEPDTDPLPRPADGLGDHYSVEPAVPWDGTMVEPQKPSFFQSWGKFLIFGAIGLAVILFSVLDKTKDVDDLAVGDCMLMPETEEISSVESTDCDAAHELEVFALITMPEGKDAAYPGEDALGDRVFEECLLRFERYVGMSYDNSIWAANPLYPTRKSWEDSNDREGSCVLFQIDANFEPLTVTGSARGSGQ